MDSKMSTVKNMTNVTVTSGPIGFSSAAVPNSTSTAILAPYSPNITFVILYSISTVLGTLVFAINLLVFSTIRFNPELRKRKELILVSVLIFADIMVGLGNVGVNGVALYMNIANSPIRIPPVLCVAVPQVMLMNGGTLFMTYTLVALSADRFISVVATQSYMTWTGAGAVKYTWIMCAFPIGAFLISQTTEIVLAATYLDPATTSFPLNCPPSLATPADFGKYRNGMLCVNSLFSVLIYLVIILILWCRPKSYHPSIQKTQIQRQMKVTKVWGFVSLFTFCCFGVTQSVGTWATYNVADGTRQYYGHMAALSKLIYSAGNMVVFLARFDEVREHCFSKLRKIIPLLDKKRVTNITNMTKKKGQVVSVDSKMSGI